MQEGENDKGHRLGVLGVLGRGAAGENKGRPVSQERAAGPGPTAELTA